MSDNIVKFPISDRDRSDNEDGIQTLGFKVKVVLEVDERDIPEEVTNEHIEAIAKFLTDEFNLWMTTPDMIFRRKAFVETLLGVKVVSDEGERSPDLSPVQPPVSHPPVPQIHRCTCVSGPHSKEAPCDRETIRANSRCVYCIGGHTFGITP